MTNKLFVTNLSYDVTQDELSELFSQIGKVVSTNIILDRETGQSRGFGFIEMSSETEALEAIKKLDNSDFKGRTLMVKESRPMTERPRNDFRNSYDNSNRRDSRRDSRKNTRGRRSNY